MAEKKIVFEALKSALRQTKEGIVLSLVIHPDDVIPELLSDPIGTRYGVAVVRIEAEESTTTSELNHAATQGLPAVSSASRQALASGPTLADSPDGRPTGAITGKPDPVRDSAKQPAVAAPKKEETALRKAQRAIVSQAGLMCRDPSFQRWMFKRGLSFEESEQGAIEGLKSFCHIRSRAQLADSEKARRLFIQLRTFYNEAKEMLS